MPLAEIRPRDLTAVLNTSHLFIYRTASRDQWQAERHVERGLFPW